MKAKISDLVHENIPWGSVTTGGRIQGGGTSAEFDTGQWRVDEPVFLADKCKQCLLCAPACPDSAIPVANSLRGGFDMDHCKGCGICAKVCPFQAIEMKRGTK